MYLVASIEGLSCLVVSWTIFFCMFDGDAIDCNLCVNCQKNSSDALSNNCSDVYSVEVFRKFCQSMSTQVIRDC